MQLKARSFNDLPSELYDIIWSYLPSKKHKWPILFVSKTLYTAILPNLYEHLEFCLDSTVDDSAKFPLLRMLQANRSLKFVREVKLRIRVDYRTEVETTPTPTADKRKSDDSAEYPEASLLVQQIPRNKLRNFWWASSRKIPPTLLATLWSRQHKLRNLELSFFDEYQTVNALFHETQWPPINKLTKLTDLRITPCREAFDFPKIPIATLQRRPRIQSLTLEFWHIDRLMQRIFTNRRLPSEILDKYKLAYLNTMLHLLSPISNGIFLKKLNLSHVNLYGCGKFLVPTVGWLQLQELSVSECVCIEELFLAMSALPDNSKPRLHCLTVIHTSSVNLGSVLQTLSDFLMGVEKVLRSMQFTFSRVSDFVHTDGFRKHCETLQELTIGFSSYSWSLGCRYQLPGLHVGWEEFRDGQFGHMFASFKNLKRFHLLSLTMKNLEGLGGRTMCEEFIRAPLSVPTLEDFILTTYIHGLSLHRTVHEWFITRRQALSSGAARALDACSPYKRRQLALGSHVTRMVDQMDAVRREMCPDQPALKTVGFGLMEGERPKIGTRGFYSARSSSIPFGPDEDDWQFNGMDEVRGDAFTKF